MPEIPPDIQALIEMTERGEPVKFGSPLVPPPQSEPDILTSESELTPLQAWQFRDALVDIAERWPQHIVRRLSWRGVGGVNPEGLLFALVNQLRHAQIILWNRDIWHAATRGCESFTGTRLEESVYDESRPMLWLFTEGSFQFEDHPAAMKLFELDVNCRLQGYMIMPTVTVESAADFSPAGYVSRDTWMDSRGRRALAVCYIFMPDDPTCERLPACVPRFRFLHPIPENAEVRNRVQAEAVAAMHFMDLKIVEVQTTNRLTKAEKKENRKAIKRGTFRQPEVGVIKLRRVERPKPEPGETQSAEAEKKWSYQCHFIVGGADGTGFWRKQYYPAEKRHKAIRIEPYVKGDLNAPFKPPRRTVYKVTE